MPSLRALKPLLALPLLTLTSPVRASSDGDTETASVPHGRRVMTLHWKDYGHGESGRRVNLTGEDGENLNIEQTKQTGSTIRLLHLKNPPLKTSYYALRGEISYHSVTGESYLQLHHHFPNRKKEPTTRTQKDSGPMQKIIGRSRWRTFWLPFDATKYEKLPDSLELELITASVGVFQLGPLELYEFTDAKSMKEVTAPKDSESDRDASLSSPKRRLGMAFTLLGITLTVGGIHYAHLRRRAA